MKVRKLAWLVPVGIFVLCLVFFQGKRISSDIAQFDFENMDSVKVDSLINIIRSNKSNWSEQENYFPTEDVLASMRNHPECIERSEKNCPRCNIPCLNIFFRSPDWTWREMCGRAGTMIVCPNCLYQVYFNLDFLN